jgi:hypothetical protein
MRNGRAMHFPYNHGGQIQQINVFKPDSIGIRFFINPSRISKSFDPDPSRLHIILLKGLSSLRQNDGSAPS